jgi:hypothetical protein
LSGCCVVADWYVGQVSPGPAAALWLAELSASQPHELHAPVQLTLTIGRWSGQTARQRGIR